MLVEGYEGRFVALKAKVNAEIPEAQIMGGTGRKGSFEVMVNDVIIFSKLELGGFPEMDDVLAAIRGAVEGRPLQKITKCRQSCCLQ
ncbi:migration and invasion enhancer 1-like [Petromyzon marinus]|uniref:migration and invasion enhancer 1-like n=1 Tax=Petromyzon marinus TaxID=7757 RepID=UPI003F72DA68